MDARGRCEAWVSRANRAVIACLMVAFMAHMPAAAQTWRHVLPLRAEAVKATAGGAPGVLYGLTDTMLWHSRDDGETWDSSPVSRPGLEASLRVGRVAIVPSDPVTLYLAWGGSVHTSRDLGETWDAGVSVFKSFPEIERIEGIAVSRADPDRVLISVMRRRPCCRGGLYATVDDRNTWRSLTPPPDYGPAFLTFVHPGSGRGYGTYGIGDIVLVEARPLRADFRKLAVTLTGNAYGFDSTDPSSVSVVDRSVEAIEIRRVERDEVVSLEVPEMEPNVRFRVKSVAFHGETGSWFVAMRISGSARIVVIATTDFGKTWVEHGSIEAHESPPDVYQLHFLDGSPGLYMRTALSWQRLRLNPIPQEGLLSVKWAVLKRR